MTIAAVGLAAIALALLAYALRAQRVATIVAEAHAERQAFLELLAEQNREAREERRSLADRIQHPERVQVQPAIDYVAPEDEPDAVELAHVGQIVPEFVKVGTPAPVDASTQVEDAAPEEAEAA